MAKSDNELSRRDWLKAVAIFGGGAAVGSLLSENEDTAEMIPGGGGGGAPTTTNPLRIGSNEVVTVDSLGWYDSIVWESGGQLVIEDGNALGLTEVSND